MYDNKIPINKHVLPDKLTKYFNTKIINLSNLAPRSEDVYNGKKTVDPKLFEKKKLKWTG